MSHNRGTAFLLVARETAGTKGELIVDGEIACAWCGAPVGRDDVGEGGVAICKACMARELGKAQPPKPEAKMHTNAHAFRWSEKAKRAAVLVADDHLPDREIAAVVGVNTSTLTRWKRHPEFRAKVAQEREALISALRRRTLLEKDARLAQLEHLNHVCWGIAEGRAKSEFHRRSAGGETGFVLRTERRVPIGNGRYLVNVREKVDVPLLAEIRASLEQIAKEMGQWSEGRTVVTQPVRPAEHQRTGEGPRVIRLEEVPDDVKQWLVGWNATEAEGESDGATSNAS
ncbi:MAG: hypothetical protein ACYC1C_04150 [Chloroflexota bacterium]